MLQEPEPCLNPGKIGSWDFASRKSREFSGCENSPGNGMEQNIPRELMLVAALRGGGDPNEAIYPSRLDRRSACSVGDGRIRDAAGSRKRDCQ